MSHAYSTLGLSTLDDMHLSSSAYFPHRRRSNILPIGFTTLMLAIPLPRLFQPAAFLNWHKILALSNTTVCPNYSLSRALLQTCLSSRTFVMIPSLVCMYAER